MFRKFISLCLILVFCATVAYSPLSQNQSIFASDPDLTRSWTLTFEFDGETITMNPWKQEPVSIDFDKGIIYVNGIDNMNTYTDIDDATKAMVLAGKKTIIFNLHSPGGSVYIMNLIILQIEILKMQGINIVTKVDENNSCMSACTLIFMHGNERIAHRRSVFMFHSPHYSGGQTEERTALRILRNLDIAAIREEFKQDIVKYCGETSKLIDDVFDGLDHYYPARAIADVCPSYITNIFGLKKTVGLNQGF